MGDDVEGSWERQLTGREVGVWCVDLIEEISDSQGEITERAKALLGRLASLDDRELVLKQLAQAAMLVTREMQFYIDANKVLAVGVSGSEKHKRALLAARSVMRGDPFRSPSKPSDEG